MKKSIVLTFALWLNFITVSAQNNWSIVELPDGAPANSHIECIWPCEQGKIFVGVYSQINNRTTVLSTGVYYFDGTWHKIFEQEGSYIVYTIHGSSRNDVFFAVSCGTDGTFTLYHYNGINCEPQTFPTTIPIGNIVGESNNYYTFSGSDIYHFNGNSWQLFESNVRGVRLLIYVGPNEIYAMDCWGHTLWDGVNWTWNGSFDFCDLYNGWGMRDESGELHLYVAGANNFVNGLRVWRFVEDYPGSHTGSWGTKYDCTYLCESSGPYSGMATGIWGSSPDNIYVTGAAGYVQPNGTGSIASRVYRFTGQLPFERNFELDQFNLDLPQLTNFGVGVVGTGPNDVWLNFGYKLAYNGTVISIPKLIGEWLQTIELPINTTSLIAEQNIISYQFNITYNPSVITYSGYSIEQTISDGGVVMVNEISTGNLSVSYATTEPLNGEGELLKLNFNCVNIGDSNIEITNFYYNNNQQTASNSTVSIQDNTPPVANLAFSNGNGIVRYGDEMTITATFSEPIADSPIPKITLSGANLVEGANMLKVSATEYSYTHTISKGSGNVFVSFISGTDTHGNLIASTPQTGEVFQVIPIRYGDIDDNTFVRAYDAALALQYSVLIDPIPDIDPLPWSIWRIETANVDGVGGVTANDASEILKYTVGLISEFPSENSKKTDSFSIDEINVVVENGEIIFKSAGDLFGLNVFVYDNFAVLSQPVNLISNALFAKNISTSNYAFAFATAYSPGKDIEIIKIPLLSYSNQSVTFDMIVNTSHKTTTIGLTTGNLTLNNQSISIFPNPASNLIYLNGLNNVDVSIYNVYGVRVLSQKNVSNSFDISSLSKGLYTIRIIKGNDVISHKFIKE